MRGRSRRVCRWVHIGIADPGCWAARWDRYFRWDAQRSGHGRPHGRRPVSGSFRTMSLERSTLGFPIQFDAETKVHGSAKKPLWIHLTFRRPSTSSIPPSHVLKGHSFIAQGSCAALPWVTGQTDRISPEGAGLTGAGRRNRRRNSIGFAGSADRW